MCCGKEKSDEYMKREHSLFGIFDMPLYCPQVKPSASPNNANRHNDSKPMRTNDEPGLPMWQRNDIRVPIPLDPFLTRKFVVFAPPFIPIPPPIIGPTVKLYIISERLLYPHFQDSNVDRIEIVVKIRVVIVLFGLTQRQRG